MNALRVLRTDRTSRLATALVGVLLATSGIVCAQQDKNKKSTSTPPAAKSAPAQAPAAHSAPQTSAPAGHAAPQQGNHPTGSTPSAPSAAGRGTAPSTYNQGTSPNAAGHGNMPNATGRGGAPNTYNQGASPNAAGHGNMPNTTGRGSVPNTYNQGASPNAAGHGNMPNATGRGSAPNTYNQGASPNAAGHGSMPNASGHSFGNAAAPGGGHTGGAPGRGNMGGGPRPEFHGANGASAHFAPSGHPTVVHTRGGATVVHAPNGARRIEVARPGGRVIVTNGAGHGYVQRQVMVHDRAFVQRTYYVHGAPYTRVYRPMMYRGVSFNVYTPMRFYSPGYYSWAYTPWSSRVYFNFGWGGSPWFGYYGGYFAPYPYYAGPNYWLTDYLVAQSLQESYQEQMDAASAAQGSYDASGQVALSPQVKDMIAAEVQRQLAEERAESQNATQNVAPSSMGVPPILADNTPHVFVVSANLIANNGSQECALTQGDVVRMNPGPSPDPTYANVQVLASKGQDCPAGNTVPLQLADLQEMQNHMRETVDAGLGELQNRQGQAGLPVIAASLRTQTAAPYAADLPPADANVADELRQQAQEADKQEQDVLGQANQAAPSNPAAPVTIEIGQTIAEVVARMGNPQRIADLGQKKTYYYKDMKVIFVDGRVSDVQ